MLKWRQPGLVLVAASLQILFLVNIAEFLYPGYSVSSNFISDLGVGPWPSSGLFTGSVILFGLMMLLTASILFERGGSLLWLLLAISGLGAVGVGVFNEHLGPPHVLSALLAFGFGNLAAIYSFKVTRPPLSYVCIGLGAVGLGALVLVGAGADLGLGKGGMERMIFYPGAFWGLAYGTYLMASEK